MISSKSFTVGEVTCDAGPDGVCVGVWRVDNTTQAEASDLIPLASWIGWANVSVRRAIDNKIADKVKGWFSDMNCHVGGCARAEIHYFGDNNVELGLETATPRP